MSFPQITCGWKFRSECSWRSSCSYWPRRLGWRPGCTRWPQSSPPVSSSTSSTPPSATAGTQCKHSPTPTNSPPRCFPCTFFHSLRSLPSAISSAPSCWTGTFLSAENSPDSASGLLQWSRAWSFASGLPDTLTKRNSIPKLRQIYIILFCNLRRSAAADFAFTADTLIVDLGRLLVEIFVQNPLQLIKIDSNLQDVIGKGIIDSGQDSLPAEGILNGEGIVDCDGLLRKIRVTINVAIWNKRC